MSLDILKHIKPDTGVLHLYAFDIIPENFFILWQRRGNWYIEGCICRLFAVTNRQLSLVEQDVLVDELQFYFDSAMAAQMPEEEWIRGMVWLLRDKCGYDRRMNSRDKANFILRRLERYGWISVDTDHSYVQRVNFRDYAVQVMKTLPAISEEKRTEYQGYIYTILQL